MTNQIAIQLNLGMRKKATGWNQKSINHCEKLKNFVFNFWPATAYNAKSLPLSTSTLLTSDRTTFFLPFGNTIKIKS